MVVVENEPCIFEFGIVRHLNGHVKIYAISFVEMPKGQGIQLMLGAQVDLNPLMSCRQSEQAALLVVGIAINQELQFPEFRTVHT